MSRNKIVYLTEEMFSELVKNGTITVNGVTVNYTEGDLYLTEDTEVYEAEA